MCELGGSRLHPDLRVLDSGRRNNREKRMISYPKGKERGWDRLDLWSSKLMSRPSRPGPKVLSYSYQIARRYSTLSPQGVSLVVIQSWREASSKSPSAKEVVLVE